MSWFNSQPTSAVFSDTGQVSQLERGEDVQVSTLRSYLDSLGARLQILAIFDDGEAETAIPIRIGAGA